MEHQQLPPRSHRHRALTRAVRLWNAHQPHQALDALESAGLGSYRREFVAQAARRARARFLREMSVYMG